MTGGVGGGREGSDSRYILEARQQEEMSLNTYVLVQTYVLMAVTGLGYLAFTWSTVVLLGGFVTLLGKKDFSTITIISMIQAARTVTSICTHLFSERIFNDLAEHLVPFFLYQIQRFLLNKALDMLGTLVEALPVGTSYEDIQTAGTTCSWVDVMFIFVLIFVLLLSLPLVVLAYSAMLVYDFGPEICIVLSLWRIGQRDYGVSDGDNDIANLRPSLDFFYSLVLCQGVFYGIWYLNRRTEARRAVSFGGACEFPEAWGGELVATYLVYAKERCWEKPASSQGQGLEQYGVDLLASDSWVDNLSGVRILDTFIRQGVDMRSLLLPSRPKIQKMIDMLGWRHGQQVQDGREITARIMAHLAGDIVLSEFPGALRSISSLLEEGTIRRQGGATCNKLLLQGLSILERLASDRHNCSDICSTAGLLPMITAPVYSATLIQDTENSVEWACVVNASLKLLCPLVRAPVEAGRRLRHEFSSNTIAVSNLLQILDQDSGAGQEVQIGAMEILTELAKDLSANLASESKENVTKKLLHIFLFHERGDEAAPMLKPVKATAGRMLAVLSSDSKIETMNIKEAYDGIAARLTGSPDDKKNIIAHLSELIDAKNSIVYRTVAAEILANLCTHCDLESDKQLVKGALLPLVLKELSSERREPRLSNVLPRTKSNLVSEFINDAMAKKKRPPQSKRSTAENDIENPRNSERENNTSCAWGDRDWSKLDESSGDQRMASYQWNVEEITLKELQESFLSLTLAICGLRTREDDPNDDVQEYDDHEQIFVAKLKTIVEENCLATSENLRIVKLCGQIAIAMMRRNKYIVQFKGQDFLKSLIKASKTMSKLESCMLFTGNDLRQKKSTIRPLLSDLVREAQQFVC